MMKTKQILLVFAILFFHNAYAQNYCGFDAYKEHLCKDDHFQNQVNLTDQIIRERILNADSQNKSSIYTIPTVVHIIHDGGSSNLSDETVENAIEWLDDAFANQGFYEYADGVDVQIRFCLAHADENGDYNSGINSIESDLSTVTIPTQDQALKDISRWDTERYLNIWVVTSLIREEDQTSIIGNSTLPTSHGADNDGIIIEAAFFGGTETQNKTLVHEVGHYLGLYHTFQSGCENSDCTTDGDQVCDTPPDGMVSGPCSEINSCSSDEDDTSLNNPFRAVELGGLGDQMDMIINYMDYSNLSCYEQFTSGQADRMMAALLDIRSSLLEEDNCNIPCDVPIDANVTVSAVEISIEENVQFANFSSNYTSATWFVNEVITASTDNFIFEPSEPGEYFIELLLENEGQGCAIELEWEIIVYCPVEASFSSSGNNLEQNESLELENTSNSELSFEWYINGELSATSTDLNTSFDNFGSYEICLNASNGECSTLYCDIFSVGNCSTGKENSNWLSFTGDSGINAYNFSNQTTETDNVDTPYSEGKSSISDSNGNLLFTSDCISLMNSNLEVTPNGSDLSGGFSAREGALFVQVPGSTDLYYLFTMDSQENNYAGGIRYNIIDRTLDGGLGDIIPSEKNIQIANPQTETMTAIRHCNYKDFWLVYYNNSDEQYEAWLFDENGITDTPISTPYDNSDTETPIYLEDFQVSPKGDMFSHDLNLFSFNPENGAIELIIQLPFEAEIRSAWAPGGKYLYMQTGLNDLTMRQLNTQLSPDEMIANHYSFAQPIFAIYADMQLTPNGEIYCPNPFADIIDVIHDPDFFAEDMNYEAGSITGTGFTNGLGNYYHAYSVQQVFVEGPDELCQGEEIEYSLFGCPDGDISWNVSPGIPFTENTDGTIGVAFLIAGFYTIQVSVETDCGVLTGELIVTVGENPYPDLGPDMNICEGDDIVLDPGQGFQSYTWNNQSTESTMTIDSPGTYWVTITENGGCEILDEIIIGETIAAEIDLGEDIKVCEDVLLLDAGDDFVNYVWQDGFSGSVYTVFEPGTYWVIVNTPCFASDTINILPCDNSISSIGLEGFEIYPNPATNSVHLSCTNCRASELTLFNSIGQVVYKAKMADDEIDLNTESLSRGLYHVQLYTDETYFTKTIILE